MKAPALEYVYTRLPSTTCIRLVEFVPSPAGEVAISLSAVELDNAPSFNALSYTWGDPQCPYIDPGPGAPREESYLQATRTIRCDGARFPVRPNLFYVLQRLRTAGTDVPHQRFIWIDAICIDQSSVSERSSQVRLMAHIYESAECVIAWTGPADDTSVDAISAISRLARAITLPQSVDQVHALRKRFAGVTEADFFDVSAYETKLGIRHMTKRDWLALLSFLYRPYFGRVWVVQEITLARHIVLLCGHLRLAWSDFAAAVFCLFGLPQWVVLLNREILRTWIAPGSPEYATFYRLRDGDPRESTFPFAAMSLVRARVYLRADLPEGAKTPKTFGLRALLSQHRSTAATDPRDKVFALLSFADASKPPLTDPEAHAAAADYNLPVEAVYIRLARLQIRSFGDLRILEHREAGHMRALQGLPSWVPDYSISQVPYNMSSDVPNCGWKASGDEKCLADGGDLGDPFLTVRGRRVGVVGKVSLSGLGGAMQTVIWGSMFDMVAELPWARFVDSRQREHLDNPDDLSLRESIDVGSLPTPMEVFARTVTYDVLQSQSPAPADALRDGFLAYAAEKYLIAWNGYRRKLVGRWHRFNITHFDRSPGERRCSPILAAFRGEPPGSAYSPRAFLDKAAEYTYDPLSNGANPMSGGFERQSQRSMSCRVLFCTDGGLLLGLGPAEMRAGDELWVLSGAKTPSILRPTASGRYRFLGETFVYGMMYGQALALFPDACDIVLE